MSPERKGIAPVGTAASWGFEARRLSSVTEWVMTEVLRHSTDWPARIWTVSGWKLAKPISTTADAFGEGGPCARPPRPQPARLARASNPGMSQKAFDIMLRAPPGANKNPTLSRAALGVHARMITRP